MLMIVLTLAASLSQAQAAAPAAPIAAVAGRTLKDLPNTTIAYYDVKGKTVPVIQKSLKKVLTDPATKDNARLYSWDVGARIMKRTTGTVCTVDNATATLSSTVRLPRLVETKINKEILANWQTYVAGLENEAASDLWFIKDRLGRVEQSMAKVNCDQATAKWDAGLLGIKAELEAHIAARTAVKAPAKK